MLSSGKGVTQLPKAHKPQLKTGKLHFIFHPLN
jgi:hypothetical protein